ncbi:calmodulin-binding transcription activator 1-like isoform X3 [Pomacea canaliculata]|uniref:calmodulin-binding transcription activator 1-like isoform X3 n=1 Tax=Pomacea canaliculata TaxID=400727 RepID=UPI000D73E3CB|nr:calmodulin-binding transcription activator 1-like isoform X3 [Pomacea canaliculata]
MSNIEGPTTSQPPPDNSQDDDASKVELPDQLQKILPATEFPHSLTRWNTNEEIAAILIAFDRHKEWLLLEPRIRPPSGSLLMYNRKKVMFRRDGYCWKKRRDGKTNREDHMKLKVKGVECIYGSYVHSAILPTFHRRCYWLLQNPHVVLVHYLNVPNHPNSPKPSLLPVLSGDMRKKEWTKEELVDQLRPMLASGRLGELHPDQDHKVEEMLEAIFQLLVGAQEDDTAKPVAMDTTHHQPLPCGGNTMATAASTLVSHCSVGGISRTLSTPLAQPQVQCTPHNCSKQELELICLPQPGGQHFQGCVSTTPHLQVTPSTLVHHHHSLQQQQPLQQPAAASTTTSSTQSQHDLHFPVVTHDYQQLQSADMTTTASSSSLTLATFSPAYLMTASPSLHPPGSVSTESLSTTITNSPQVQGQTVIPATVSLLASITSPEQAHVVIAEPATASSLTTTSDSLPHKLFSVTAPSGLFKSEVSSDLPQEQRPHQHQQVLTRASSLNNVGGSVPTQNQSGTGMVQLCAGSLIVKDNRDSVLGGLPNVITFGSGNPGASAPQTVPLPSQPDPTPAKDIPLFAANPLAPSSDTSGCDAGQVDEDCRGASGSGIDMGLADSSDNCDTLDGSFSSLPSTDLNLDLFLDLQDLDECAVDLAATTSLSPQRSANASLSCTQLDTSHLSLTSSATLVCSSSGNTKTNADSGGNPLVTSCVQIPSVSENGHVLPGSYLQSVTPAQLSPNHLQVETQSSSASLLLPSRWEVATTAEERHTLLVHSGSAQHLMTKDINIKNAGDVAGLCGAQQKNTRSLFTVGNFPSHHILGEDSAGDNLLEQTAVISDFSPDWSFTEGNTKILVAGPWCVSSATYTCIFGSKHVAATLIQPGVLRCFAPAHEAGQVTLQVAQNGFVISSSETFEFRSPASQQQQIQQQQQKQQQQIGQHQQHHQQIEVHIHADWFDMSCQHLMQLLLDRLGELKRRFISGEKPPSLCSDQVLSCDIQESDLVAHVEGLSKQLWCLDQMYPKVGHGGLTLLHLVSALGLAKLISVLIRWRSNNPSPALEYEVDAHSVDNHACTPLMWACAKGQTDAALTLYHWNSGPLRVCNKDGHLPLAVAHQRGHHNLATQLEQLEQAHFKAPAPAPAKVRCQSIEAPSSPCHQDLEMVHQPMSPEIVKVEPPEMAGIHNLELASTMQMSQATTPHHPPQAMQNHGKLVRRLSEQVISPSTSSVSPHGLSKRYSVDILTHETDSANIMDHPAYHTRDTSSEPRFPIKSKSEELVPDLQKAPSFNFFLESDNMLGVKRKAGRADHTFLLPHDPGQFPMDTDDTSVRSDSPFIDVEHVSDDEQDKQDDSKHQMVTLANQIIAAIPERIKLSPSKTEEEEDGSINRTRSESHSSSVPSQGSPRPSSSSFGDDSGISTPMTDSLAFDEYRYTDFGTPASSLSPDSTCLPSPYSPYSFALDSPPPTTAEFTEYFNAPATYMEKDFSQLTLSDQEQRKLYEAAKVIQNAYRHYRDKQQQQQHQKEIEAAVLIQSYYRRYKQYAYYKKMTQAAVLIQNQFRSYSAQKRKKNPGGSMQGVRRESERLKKGRNQSVIIQQRYRSHYQRKSLDGKEGATAIGATPDAPDRYCVFYFFLMTQMITFT